MDTTPEFEQASTIQSTQVQPTTKTEFWKKRWYTPYHIVTVINPKSEDYHFLAEGRPFTVKAGSSVQLPGPVANVYVNAMAKMLAQDENKIEFISDFALMEVYYARLIPNVTSLIQDAVDVTPSYITEAANAVAPEAPPWIAPESQPQAPPAPTIPTPKPAEKTTEDLEEKNFEEGGDKYRSIVNKNGNRMYYRNGQLTNEAEYAKAASKL